MISDNAPDWPTADLKRRDASLSPGDQMLCRWAKEWQALRGTIHRDGDKIALGQLLYFRDHDWEALANDTGCPPHLRIDGRHELAGARKALERLLIGNPGAIDVIAALASGPHG